MNGKEKIGHNIRKFRQEKGLTQKQLGEIVGKSESQIGTWELGKSEMPASMIFELAEKLRISPEELVIGQAKREQDSQYDLEARIYNLDDRLTVINILAKNGYDVGQHKRQRTPTGKTLDYYVHAKLVEGNTDTSK